MDAIAAFADMTIFTQLTLLLSTAVDAIKRAGEYTDMEELDKAYVQYLRASEITINTIPHHPDYRDAINHRPGWYKQFADLMMVCMLSLSSVVIQKLTWGVDSPCE